MERKAEVVGRAVRGGRSGMFWEHAVPWGNANLARGCDKWAFGLSPRAYALREGFES